MADDYQIKIKTEGDPRGAERVTDSLQKVTRSANDTSKAAAASARGMNELGEASEKGAAVGRVLSEAMRGNIGALTQLGAALKATGAAMKTNVFGVLLIAATALLNVLPGLIEKLTGSKDKTADLGKAAEETQAALAKMAQVRLDNLKAQLDAVSEGSKAALSHLERINSAAQRIDNARMAVELAELNADKTLTPEQKQRREFEIREKFAGNASQRERASIEERVFQEEQNFRQYDAIASAAESERDRFLAARDNVAAERARIDKARKQLDESPVGDGIGSYDARRFELEEQERRIQEREKFMASPEWSARRDLLERSARDARGRANGASQALGEARLNSDVDQTSRPIIRSLESKAGRINAGIPEPESKTGSFSEIVGGEISVRGKNGEDIGRKIADRVEKRIRDGEEAIFRALDSRMRTLEQQTKSMRTR